MSGHENGGQSAEKDVPWGHDFLPVKGHPDDDECTYRSDGTDATYCGRPAVDHGHHPNCYQSTGDIPDVLPDDLCDCRVLRMIDAATRDIPPAEKGGE